MILAHIHIQLCFASFYKESFFCVFKVHCATGTATRQNVLNMGTIGALTFGSSGSNPKHLAGQKEFTMNVTLTAFVSANYLIDSCT